MNRRGTIAAIFATLAMPALAAGQSSPTTLTLETASGAKVAVSHWPAQGKKQGVIAFSHGASSAPRFYTDLLKEWNKAGFEIYAPLHRDSREHPEIANFNPTTGFKSRIEDMRAVSAHISGPYIAAGHSYGGLMSLIAGGAQANPPAGVTTPLADPAVKAVVAFSPPAPIPGMISKEGYATLAVPAFVQTGTKDIPTMGAAAPAADPDAWRGHLVPYEAASASGNRYALVIDQVDHYFGGVIGRDDRPGPKQAKELADAASLSTQFMLGYGTGPNAKSKKAIKALDSNLSESGPNQLLKK